jgi:hypothetical protein
MKNYWLWMLLGVAILAVAGLVTIESENRWWWFLIVIPAFVIVGWLGDRLRSKNT